ncbi:MAG: hypothetical protein LAO05_15255 [Acidobacteriia bacterium]|nr:hypothetical protein [Terriglobia bacterium]
MSGVEPVSERRNWLFVGAAAVVLGAVVGGLPLMSGAPGGDDAYYHAMRGQQEARCWRLGVPYPRWYPDLNGGLGGPEPRAYPLIPLALLGLLAAATGDGISAISVGTVLIPVVAALAMMFSLRRRGVGPAFALSVSAGWAAAPYLVVALHERAALAEALALAFLPMALEAMLPPEPLDRRSAVRGAIFLAVLLATQLPVALMTGAVAALCHLASGRRGHAGSLLLAGVVGLGLSAASWVPNVGSVWRLQGEHLVGTGYRWQDNLLPGGNGADAILAGHLTLALAATGVLLVLVLATGSRRARTLAGVGLAAVALSTPLLGWVYRWLPGLAFLQFPWRWLGPAGCLGLMAVGEVDRRAVRAIGLVAFLLPLAVPVAFRWRLAEGPPMRPRDPGSTVARAATRFGVPPLLPSLPAYLPRGVDLSEALASAARAHALVTAVESSSPDRFEFRCESPAGGAVSLSLLADDSWSVEVDNRRVGWSNLDGLVSVPVAPGLHRIVARQSLLPEDVAGLALSLTTVVGILLLSWPSRRRPPLPGS